MTRILMAVFAVFTLAVDSHAAGIRRHFDVKNGGQVLQITEIKDLSNAAHVTRWLVRDDEGVDYLVSESIDFTVQKSTYEIRDLRRKSFLRVSFDRPYKAKTRAETLASTAEQGNVVSLKYEAGDAVIFASEAELADTAMVEQLTRQLRRNMDPHLLDAIERMGGLWNTDAFAAVSAILVEPALRYHKCDQRSGVEVAAPPDCDFDSSFGAEYRCSEASKAKIAEAAAKGSVIKYY